MSNVEYIQERAPRFSESRVQRPTGAANADISELVSRVTGLQTKVIGQIDNAALMLDLAAQHARQIAKRVRDPAVKDQFDEHLSTIEQLLQFAREKAMKLRAIGALSAARIECLMSLLKDDFHAAFQVLGWPSYL